MSDTRAAKSIHSKQNTRSFTSCNTCRGRRVKCDQKRPSCSTCLHARLECAGYDVKIAFVNYLPNQSDTRKHWKQDGQHYSRQMLCTVQERAEMSDRLIRSVQRDGIDNLLEQLDASLAKSQAVSNFHGSPFGTFWVQKLLDLPNSYVSPAFPSDVARQEVTEDIQDSDYLLNNQFQCGQFLSMVATNQIVEELLPDQMFDVDEILGIDNYHSAFHNELITEQSEISSPSPWASNILTSRTEINLNGLPPSATFLLNHYKEQMGILFSPLRAKKPPWEILHYPSAMRAFSELSLSGKTSHGKYALFLAVLSVSAFHLDKVTVDIPGTTDFWWKMGEGFREQAKTQLQLSCNSELNGPGKAKYKDILMAILTMVTISVVNGRQDEVRSFLLNAELFICYRGIPKAVKSRKVKLLHHIYLFLRVIEESTHIYPFGASMSILPSLPLSNMQFPSLRTYSLVNGNDLDECCGDNFELGLLDSPDTRSSFRDSTIFGLIYGFPEELLAFISRATAIANEISMITPHGALNIPHHLVDRSQSLEHDICTWKYEVGFGDTAEELSSTTNRKVIAPLILAIHGAILVYFYRRVKIIHPFALQPHVESIVKHLEQHEEEKITSSVMNAGIVWPGFIAAVEALDEQLQQRAFRWLRECARRTGMRNFDTAADFAMELWKYRDAEGDVTISWTKLVQDRNSQLIFS